MFIKRVDIVMGAINYFGLRLASSCIFVSHGQAGSPK